VQLRLHLKYYPPASGGHHRNEADELQHIAKSLFTLDQDLRPLKRFAAPSPLQKDIFVGEVHREPAPLVFAPAGGEISHYQSGPG
jgi:hypothetical protein